MRHSLDQDPYLLPNRAFVKVGRKLQTLEGGGKSSAPPAPDYTAAAQATAAGNADAARIAAKANRVSQYTPYGNLVYKQGQGLNQTAYDQAMANYQKQLDAYNLSGGDNQKTSNIMDGGLSPNIRLFNNLNSYTQSIAKPVAPNIKDYMQGDPDTWSATVQLTPEQQALLDKQNQMSLQLGDVGLQGVGYVQNMLNQPFDTSKLPAEQITAGQTAQDALMARLNPQFDRQQAALQQQLANQGIGQGTQAYENAMDEFNRAKNDAYTQAALQGINVGQQARQQALQEQAYLRNEPLNTLNAVRTGSQVTNPNFVGVPQQATTAGPDIMGATQAGYNANLANYNAQQAGNNAMMGGLFSLGGSVLGAGGTPWWMI